MDETTGNVGKTVRKVSDKQAAFQAVFRAYLEAKGIPVESVGYSDYGRNGRAVKALLEMSNGDPARACRAIKEIGHWLDGLLINGQTPSWGLEGVVNNYLQWWSEVVKREGVKRGDSTVRQILNSSEGTREGGSLL